MTQQMFCPVDFGSFRWTDDWYSWDAVEGHREAMRARDAKARILRQAGHHVRKFTLRNQVITLGGVGTKCPHIEFVVTCYGLSY
jgi:hypothetical protein